MYLLVIILIIGKYIQTITIILYTLYLGNDESFYATNTTLLGSGFAAFYTNSYKLRWISIPVLDFDTCKKEMETEHDEIVTDNMICAGNSTEEYFDPGDSGGNYIK